MSVSLILCICEAGSMKLYCFILACCIAGTYSAVINKREATSDENQSGQSVHDNAGRRKRDIDEELKTQQVSTNCRTVVAINANSPIVCSKQTDEDGKQVDGEVDEYNDPNIFTGPPDNDLDLKKMPGRCRFDPYRAAIDPSSACLCVATQETCTKGRDGCYWHYDKETGYSECISKAEKYIQSNQSLCHNANSNHPCPLYKFPEWLRTNTHWKGQLQPCRDRTCIYRAFFSSLDHCQEVL